MSATQALHAAAPRIAVEACYRSVKSLRPPFLTFLCKPLLTRTRVSPSLAIRKAASPARLLVARTSDWAQKEEEEESGVNAFGEEQTGLSDWEGEGVLSEGESEGGEFEEGEGEAEGGEYEDGGLVVEDKGSVGGEEEGGYAEPPEEAKVFVGNLPYDIDSEGLAKLFDQAGIVEVAEVVYDRVTDRSRGFGFVTMSTVEEADKAIQMLHRYDYNGRLLTVNKASPAGSRPERPPREQPASRIYVGNLPWQVDDARLEQIFSEHGKVVDVRVISDRETGRSRGFGFVTMSSQTEVEDAIAALDGQSVDGRVLRVNLAQQRSRNGF